MVRHFQAWIREEKGEHHDHYTVKELAAYLGVAPLTIKRRLTAGTVPPPAQVTPKGWQLWSPAQAFALMKKEAGLDG